MNNYRNPADLNGIILALLYSITVNFIWLDTYCINLDENMNVNIV